ncbi:hypothetical protein A167_00892 [Alcanivorax sp. S71-1-4]|jgi:uncharacterized lipoprotein|uniref:outer membrane protein assembly factor BamC n=1 Tax=Alcanivorax sp. S71-1-4 TaxID=1177159 RepID=UPI0013575D4C|nr:outer membrane protein assembly factor BamC [Alcanivorax sp. S71-1-4]KAF0810211.1 hypothetical protein A167_00892 [Alcanivorax sp. S71-1-4]
MNRTCLTVVLLPVLMTGCSWVPDRTLVYQEAQTDKRMDVPEGMWFSGFDDRYPIPDVENRIQIEDSSGERFVVPEPPQLVVLGQADAPDETSTPRPDSLGAILGRDGNGYPIIMLNTQFVWAWEYVGQAVGKTDLRVDDRDRDSGIFYVRVPSEYGLKERQAQLKLSQTVNGIQVAVLNQTGTSLVDREPGQAILQRLYNEL